MAQEKDGGNLRVFGWSMKSKIETTKGTEKKGRLLLLLLLTIFFWRIFWGWCCLVIALVVQ